MKRFRLSTLLIVTVLAGAFIGANLLGYTGSVTLVITGQDVWNTAHGFPWTYQESNKVFPSDAWFSWQRLLGNAVVGLLSLMFVGYTTERIGRTSDSIRLHLSTLLMLTVLAGVFVGTNCLYHDVSFVSDGSRMKCVAEGRGFPLHWESRTIPERIVSWQSYQFLGMNCLIGLMGLVLVGYFTERAKVQRQRRVVKSQGEWRAAP